MEKKYRSKPHRNAPKTDFREIQCFIRGRWRVIGYTKTKKEANIRIRKLNKEVKARHSSQA